MNIRIGLCLILCGGTTTISALLLITIFINEVHCIGITVLSHENIAEL